MLRQTNQYNVLMPATYITEVPFLRVKDTQKEILALERAETSMTNQPTPRNNPRILQPLTWHNCKQATWSIKSDSHQRNRRASVNSHLIIYAVVEQQRRH